GPRQNQRDADYFPADQVLRDVWANRSNRSDIVYGARTVGGETRKRRSTFGQSDGLDSGRTRKCFARRSGRRATGQGAVHMLRLFERPERKASALLRPLAATWRL